MGQERNDRLVTGHTYVDGGGVQWKNQRLNIFLFGDSGFSEEDEDDDDTKIRKSRVNKFSRGELKVRMRYYGVCTARYEPVSYCWSILKAS